MYFNTNNNNNNGIHIIIIIIIVNVTSMEYISNYQTIYHHYYHE